MNKFKEICHKIAYVLEWIIGYSLFICLFVGGLGFFGFVVALCIGGDTATMICKWLYSNFYKYLTFISTATVLLCLLMLYLRGDANWQNPIKYWRNKIASKKLRLAEQKEESKE